MASPQAIVAIVVVLARLGDVTGGRLMLVLAILATMTLNLAVLWGFASATKPDAGKTSSGASEVILRVVAILLAGLAVQLIILGFRDLGVLPALAPHD